MKIYKNSKMAEITNSTKWEDRAAIAETASKEEDKSIWEGNCKCSCAEELAAYAYHLGRLDALHDAAVNLQLSDNGVVTDLFQIDSILDINMRTGFVHWSDEHGGDMFLVGIEKDGGKRKIVFQREEE